MTFAIGFRFRTSISPSYTDEHTTETHARLLVQRAKEAGAHVNLIPLNHVEESRYRPSTQGHLKAFIRILEESGVNVTVRRRLGSDIDASCGQLRRKFEKSREK